MSCSVMMPDEALLKEPAMSAAAAMLPDEWPRAVPYGGSKWARFFGGPLRPAPASGAASLHENALFMPDGTLSLDDTRQADAAAEIVFALAGGPDLPLGLFLSSVLPGIHRHVHASLGYRLAGPKLTEVQNDVLGRLGWQARYITVTAPQRFAAVMVAQSGLDAPAFAALMGMLRPAAGAFPAAVMILPPPAQEQFSLRNRSSLVAWLRARQIMQLAPETLGFDVLAERLAGAKLVLLADPAQAGLLGLCQPGTKVLELAPEGWVSGQVRTVATALGLDWRLFLGAAPSYPVLQPPAVGAAGVMSYDIPIGVLGRTLAVL